MRVDNTEDVKAIFIEMENLFTNLDSVKKELENEICVKEAEQTDYLHELELAKLNGIEIMKVANSLIKTRKERRKLKNRLELVNTIKGFTDEYIKKGIVSNLKQLIKNIDTLKSNQETREYTPKAIKTLKCAKKREGGS